MITGELFEQVGELYGARLIVERGTATNDGGDLTELREYETGRVDLVPVPRARGLVVKSLDGREVKTRNLETVNMGDLTGCVQLGRTRLAQIAPEQPSGMLSYTGKIILRYERVWVQTEAA